MDNRQVRMMKIVLLFSSLASLLILAVAAYRENFRGEWRTAQNAYREHLLHKAEDDRSRRAAAFFTVGHKQYYLAELGRIDRCGTCHLGVENPAMADAPQPLTAHPGNLLALHPAERFGCTICHEGQGREVLKHRAHGWTSDGTPVPHIERPLLRGQAVYTSCGACHYEGDLFGGLSDLHARRDTGETREDAPAIDAFALTRAVPGAVQVAAGKRLVVESGCLGCHQYRGRGGVLGPDITHVGDKTRHDFDFSHIAGEHTVEQWLFEHFMLPSEVSPDTVMPDMGYTQQQAMQLTHYMMSLHRKSAPAGLRPPPPSQTGTDFEPVRGETLYLMFCSACHGKQGYGSTLRSGLWPVDADPWGHEWEARDIVAEQRGGTDVMVPSLNHPDTLAVASHGYLRQVVEVGRPGTNMIAWADAGGLTADEITLVVDFITRWQLRSPEVADISSSRGEPAVGAALFRANCASCHGQSGEGGIGPSLNSPTFLAVASDAFLRDTIVHGRADTAMPAWRQFNAQEISDLLAFTRRWQPQRATLTAALQLCAEGETSTVSADIGRILYKANCVMCHGSEGQGDLGPSLNTQEFLTVVGDDYLLRTLLEGRPTTAMPSWRHLADADLASIVLHLRSWQTEPAREPTWRDQPVPPGDVDAGRIHFVSHCSGCHGVDAEGATGPQLNNLVFLQTTTDRMLQEWIAFGKSGTEMRGFRKGGQGIVELSDRQIEDVVAYLRSLADLPEGHINRVAKSPHGRPEKGAQLYVSNCAGCHGVAGEGATGPALSNPDFLRYASDGFLMATLALGRSGTEMRPVKRSPQSILGLSSDEVNDVVAYLRSWEHASPLPVALGQRVAHRFVVPWDLRAGRQLFESHCAACHGPEGAGAWAPQLNNEGFLAAATDGFLQATIVRGRAGTAMRAFGRGAQGLVDLEPDDIDNIVAYMRSWSVNTPSPMTIPAERSLAVEAPHVRDALSVANDRTTRPAQTQDPTVAKSETSTSGDGT